MMDAEWILQGSEQAVFRLRELYQRHGYLPYKMSKFEEYDLYVRNKSFLVSEQILTFTDMDGKLMVLHCSRSLGGVVCSADARAVGFAGAGCPAFFGP